jgi:hypothetical protein
VAVHHATHRSVPTPSVAVRIRTAIRVLERIGRYSVHSGSTVASGGRRVCVAEVA